MSEDNHEIRDIQRYIRLPFARDHWYVAGLASEFGRDLVGRTLLERSIVFYRTEAGGLVALQNRCLHRSYPLCESKLDGDDIVCGYHGIRYSPDGDVLDVPCQDGCPRNRLRKYPVREVGPFVFIWMGDPEAADDRLPDLGHLDEYAPMTILGSNFVEGNYLLLQENLNDLTHFSVLHAKTFGAGESPFGEGFMDLPTEYVESDGVLGCYRQDERAERILPGYPPDVQERIGGRKIRNRNGGISFSPGVWLGENFTFVEASESRPAEAFRSHIDHYLTPETATTTHYWWSVTSNFGDPAMNPIAKQALGAAFEEDVVAVRLMQDLLDKDRSDHDEMSVKGDKAGVQFRRKMLEWIQAESSEKGT